MDLNNAPHPRMPRIKNFPFFGPVGVLEPCYNTIRPHASLGYKPPAPEVFVPALWRRHWLRDGNPND